MSTSASIHMVMTDKEGRQMTNLDRAKLNSTSFRNRGGMEYVINSMLMIALVGMCIKMFFGNNTSIDGSYGHASSTIYGYGVVAFAILTVMFITFAIHDRVGRMENKGGLWGILSFLKGFISSSAPSIFTIITLCWIISLNISHFTQINKGVAATEYFQLSKGSSFLIIIQILCLFQYLKLFINNINPNGDKKDAASNMARITFATYFIIAINLIVAGMMTIILTFFSTDG